MYNAIYFLSLLIVTGDPSNSENDKTQSRRATLVRLTLLSVSELGLACQIPPSDVIRTSCFLRNFFRLDDNPVALQATS